MRYINPIIIIIYIIIILPLPPLQGTFLTIISPNNLGMQSFAQSPGDCDTTQVSKIVDKWFPPMKVQHNFLLKNLWWVTTKTTFFFLGGANFVIKLPPHLETLSQWPPLCCVTFLFSLIIVITGMRIFRYKPEFRFFCAPFCWFSGFFWHFCQFLRIFRFFS